MSVAQLSLNELSRRVGLAKSNVLRYFEPREAVLLELLDVALGKWLQELDRELAAAVDATAPPTGRCDQLSATIATSLAARPVLCDLVSAQAAVLERNVSPKAAAEYKRAAIASVGVLVGLVRVHLPELAEEDGMRFAAYAVMVTGSAWTHSQPFAAMLAAYEADPELAALRLDFTSFVREALEVLLSGLLARAAR
ncbi:TetR/AcrR family transcriptional regulator [Streptomyces sp. NPDC047525]|uniref:TetR/AcrR family transcriptional regulator n=1 Tax=Streptomyces sp. NPDC047525 TaxID=3155264 RepID=UPI0033E51C89